MTQLGAQQIADEKLGGWAYLIDSLRTRVPTPDFAAGLALVNALGAAAERADHHPDIDLRCTRVDIRLTSHDTGAVTGRDIRMARTISALIADVGLTQECASVMQIGFVLDSPAHSASSPFWAAVLHGEPGEQHVADPYGVVPLVVFQESGTQEPRQRWHPDVWVDPAQGQPRLDAALAAGGTLVSDAAAPSFWVLADPEGNRVCLCTWQERSEEITMPRRPTRPLLGPAPDQGGALPLPFPRGVGHREGEDIGVAGGAAGARRGAEDVS